MSKLNSNTFTAGRLAKAAAVNIQTVRFYDREGILKPISRTASGYRIYNGEGLKRLKFIIQAKELGFSLNEIRDLLSLRIRSAQACDRVRKKAQDKISDIQNRIAQLRKLERTLEGLVRDCKSRLVSDRCPILEKMGLRDD
ncbi:MAG: heavy metal-responsive transcriptional regulator [Bdellovibrionales bacterium]